MIEFLCRLRIHDFSGWSALQELPLWRHGGDYAIGNQPTQRNLYTGPTPGTLIEKTVTDLRYILVGKAIEQRRTCKRCYLVQTRMEKSRV